MLIPEKDAAQFLALYLGLLYYAGDAQGVIPRDMSFDSFLNTSMAVKARCRDALYEPTPLFEDFIEDNSDHLPNEHQAAIRAWGERHVRGKFVMLQHTKEHTIFLSTDDDTPKAYAVLGLTTDLSEMFPKAFMPVFLETVLLPYTGVIVCDGLVIANRVLIGPNMTRNMKADYAKIRREGKVITSL